MQTGVSKKLSSNYYYFGFSFKGFGFFWFFDESREAMSGLAS